jgi:hypothetical protein
MINKILKQEQAKVITELFQKLVAKKWSEKMVAETPEELKNLDVAQLEADIKTKENEVFVLKGTDKQLAEYELGELKSKQTEYNKYQQEVKNVELNTKFVEMDVFAYNAFAECEKEVKKLL